MKQADVIIKQQKDKDEQTLKLRLESLFQMCAPD